MAKYELPPLPYDYNALEPHYDEATVRLHHDKHHAAYVAGLNKAEEKLEEARASGDFAMVQCWERQLAFNSSGDILHTIFWENMSPNPDAKPTGHLMEQIHKDFGSFEAFKNQFNNAATTVEGNGWSILAWSPELQKLVVAQVENHQKQVAMGMVPLLVLDMWEHAYYLKFQNRKPEWVESWWHLANWADVSKRWAEVSRCAHGMVAEPARAAM